MNLKTCATMPPRGELDVVAVAVPAVAAAAEVVDESIVGAVGQAERGQVDVDESAVPAVRVEVDDDEHRVAVTGRIGLR